MNKQTVNIQKLVLSALCMALCFVLPFLTANNYQLNTAISPMHIPVFLCAFLCGPWWSMAVGLISPVFRSMIMQAPPPETALAMSFELAAYGLCAGLLYMLLSKKKIYPFSLYISMVVAMVIGRVVSVLAKIIIFGFDQNSAGIFALFADAFVKTLPGIAIQLVLVPVIVMALQNALPWLKTKK